MTAATSRTARASGESRAARARTASPTEVGTVSPSVASTSVTKNGLPPVKPVQGGRIAPAPVRQLGARPLPTAGAELMRWTVGAVARSPRTRRRG